MHVLRLNSVKPHARHEPHMDDTDRMEGDFDDRQGGVVS